MGTDAPKPLVEEVLEGENDEKITFGSDYNDVCLGSNLPFNGFVIFPSVGKGGIGVGGAYGTGLVYKKGRVDVPSQRRRTEVHLCPKRNNLKQIVKVPNTTTRPI